MRRAVGRWLGGAKLKRKGDERRCLWKNQSSARDTTSPVVVPPAFQHNSYAAKGWSMLIPPPHFNTSCAKFSVSFRHNEQHENAWCFFGVSAVTSCLETALSALFTSHMLSAVLPKFRGCVPALFWCPGAVTLQVNDQSSLVSSSQPSYLQLVVAAEQSQVTVRLHQPLRIKWHTLTSLFPRPLEPKWLFIGSKITILPYGSAMHSTCSMNKHLLMIRLL